MPAKPPKNPKKSGSSPGSLLASLPGSPSGSSPGSPPKTALKCYPGYKVFANYPIPTIFYEGETGKILNWNKAAQEHFGYKPNEFTTILDFLHTNLLSPKTLAEFESFLYSPLGTNQIQSMPSNCCNKQGNNFLAELQVWAATDNNFAPKTRALHFCKLLTSAPESAQFYRYIAQIEQMESKYNQELDRHKKWLNLAIEGSGEGLWLLDFRRDTMEFATTYILNLLGYTPKDMANAPFSWDEITHPEDLVEVKKRLQDHFNGKTPFYQCEYRTKAKNGDWHWILGYCKVISRDEHNNPLEAMGTHVDIHRLKCTEENLLRSELHFQTLVENASIGLVLVSPNAQIRYVNPRFTALFGYEKNEVPDLEAWWKLAIPNNKQREAYLKKRQEAETKLPTQIDLRAKSGFDKHVLQQISTLNDNTQIISYEDVSAQVIYERALLKREKELREKSQKLEEMNAALRIVLERVNSDKEELENRVYVNIRDLIMPYVDKLEGGMQSSSQQAYLNTIKTNLHSIISSFTLQLTKQNLNLTPREVEVANMINEGLSNKDIAAVLYLSESAIEFHRHNIRKKLGIVDKKINLKTYLRGIK